MEAESVIDDIRRIIAGFPSASSHDNKVITVVGARFHGNFVARKGKWKIDTRQRFVIKMRTYDNPEAIDDEKED